MNDNLKAQQVMNDSISKLRETFQTWLQQWQEHVVNLDTYTPVPLQCRKIPIYYDDDDDEESSIPLRDIIISKLPQCIAITPVLLTEEPVDSLIMEDKHLDTIPEMETMNCKERRFYSTFFHSSLRESTSSDDESSHEEIDIFPGPDDSIPPGIKSDYYDSKVDDNSTSLSEFESFHVDYPDSGDSTIDVVEDIPVDVQTFATPPPFIWISTSFLLIMISDPILMFLPLSEIETRFMIRDMH
ncbi:hypothetical protein Tco_0711098 [Tanacetum coccineum]